MFAPRIMSLLMVAALCAGSLHAQAADGAAKSFGRLDLADKWLSPQRFGPSSAFFSAPLGEEITTPPVRANAERPPAPASAQPENARAEAAPPAAAPEQAKPRRATPAKRPAAAVRAADRKPKSNPMDSYAKDTRGNRSQAWPCKGGGICAWQ